MYGSLTQVKEPGKDVWRDIAVITAHLHLLVATLHGISSALRGIVQNICVIQPLISCPLTQREHDAHSLAMELGDSGLQQLAFHHIAKTGSIAQTQQGNT